MFSQTVEYALRAVTYLAQNCESACTTEQIAKATSVPQAYLAKVLQSLLRSGITQSQRGIKGGIRLARSAEELSMLDVVQAVDPIKRIDHCPLPIEGDVINGHGIRNEHGSTLCPLHLKLDQALAAVEEIFNSTTLAKLVDAAKAGNPLCHSNAVINGREKFHAAG